MNIVTLEESLLAWLRKLLFRREPEQIEDLKAALRANSRLNSAGDLWGAIQDYPLMCDLARAYIQHGDTKSAQDVIRVCFKLRDEYATAGGHRDAFSINRLVKEFVAQGREDIARHIQQKIRNFEAGVPLHLLSTEFVPDRETLRARMADTSELQSRAGDSPGEGDASIPNDRNLTSLR